MKKRLTISVALLLLLALMVSLFAACGGEKTLEFEPTTDNYRTYYQIFPYSFADSDGDGIGDIQGIIAKLDYIADMNFDGIWLTPVHQSGSYHKYDVEDYKSIDRQFGTMQDYDKLVEECHKRGMTVLLDLVINHTSSNHPWFESACAARRNGAKGDKYYNYYNFSDVKADDKWYYVGDGMYRWYYEGQFWSGMPDLNLQAVLDNPDGDLAQDLKEVMRFWLIDHNVDGFRLDATGEYFTGNVISNVEFLSWLNDTAKSIKPDCYIVGEGVWNATVYSYYESGIDSFFLFNHNGNGGSLATIARGRTGSFDWYMGIEQTNQKNCNGGIPAMFVSNHDIGRAYAALGSRVQNAKLAYGVMSMCMGTTYWYYGDEVGMSSGTGKPDENIRQPMPWGDSYQCRAVSGTTLAEADKYPLGDVKKNLKDSDSLLNYIKRANALRRAFPEIARSYAVEVFNDGDSLGMIKKGEGDSEIYIAMNLSPLMSGTIDLSRYGNFELVGTLSVDKIPSLKGATLTLPTMSFAVLRKV